MEKRMEKTDYKITEFHNSEFGSIRMIEDDMDIGSIFFGGHYSRLKYKDAEERAWTSLILDIIGKSDDVEIRKFHNLTRALETFGPHLNFNFENIEELKNFLNSYDI